tara:strand:+ start:1623 stop:2675 length:1053 start_codon:yes stop_codon:yes gene_type:complete
MGVNYSGSKTNQTELAKIQEEIYAESNTFRDGLVEIDQNHKSGADVYESSVEVTAAAYSTDGVNSATGDIDMLANKTSVALNTFQYSDLVDEDSLKGTRFERSMQAGAFNIDSTEFDQKVLIQVAPAIGEDVENFIWNGATTAKKSSIAGLTPGAGQGSISAGAQTLVAAMPTNLVNSLPATILYNDSQAKATPGAGLGDYIKVPSIAAIDASTIADEYSKMYLAAPSKAVNYRKNGEVCEIFAPLSHRQLIKTANNSVGAASNKNFLVEGSGENETISYNGHKINFVPLVDFMIMAIPSYMKILCDLVADVSSLKIGEVANGASQRYIKNIQTMTTWVVGQKYITLYGG